MQTIIIQFLHNRSIYSVVHPMKYLGSDVYQWTDSFCFLSQGSTGGESLFQSANRRVKVHQRPGVTKIASFPSEYLFGYNGHIAGISSKTMQPRQSSVVHDQR